MTDTGGLVTRSERALLEGISRREFAALAEVYERHGPAVHGLARRLCGADGAPVVVRDVFLTVWRDPPSFDPTASHLGEHLARLTHLRSSDRSVSTERDSGLGPDEDREAELATRLGHEAWQMLSQLPSPLRDALALASFAGYSFGEIAALLTRLEGAVLRDLRTGLRHLQLAIADEDDGETDPAA